MYEERPQQLNSIIQVENGMLNGSASPKALDLDSTHLAKVHTRHRSGVSSEVFSPQNGAARSQLPTNASNVSSLSEIDLSKFVSSQSVVSALMLDKYAAAYNSQLAKVQDEEEGSVREVDDEDAGSVRLESNWLALAW